jgi:ferrous iron transport protein B
VYVLLAGTFFGASAGNAIFSIYGLGIALAIAMGKLFRVSLFRGDSAPFVMELPPYRVPTLKSLVIHMWDRSGLFLRKMGRVILIGSVVVWFLGAFPRHAVVPRAEAPGRMGAGQLAADSPAPRPGAQRSGHGGEVSEEERLRLEGSYLGRLGHLIEPVFAPLGFDWRTSVAVISGFVAKEIVVSTLGVLHAAGADVNEESEVLRRALRASGMTPLGAYALMAFVLTYVPCLATVGAIRRETNSWKWTAFSITYSLTLAWVVAFVIFQGGRLLGLG